METPLDPPDVSGLSLVDKNEFEDFLVVSELSAKLESANEAVLRNLNHRLGNVCDVRVHNENNPVGPVAVCHAFRAAAQVMALSDDANRVIYDAFGLHLVETAAQVYATLDRLLDGKGLSAKSRFGPESTPEPMVRARSERAGGREPDISQSEQGRISGRDVGSESGPGWGPGLGIASPLGSSTEVELVDSAPPAVLDTHSLGFKLPIDSTGGADVAPSGAGLAVGKVAGIAPGLASSRPAAAHQIGAQAAYGATQALMGMRRAQTARFAEVTGLPGEGPDAGSEQFSAAEILDAIASLPSPAPPPRLGDLPGFTNPANTNGAVAGSFKEQILSLLGTQTEPGAKRIGDDELDALELVENLFEAFTNELYLAESMKPRLLRLEPAVQRAALVDQSVLTARGHVVRQFLNGLDEVDVLAKVEGGKSQLEEVVDPILERVVQESERDPSAFHLALDLVEAVLEGQRQTYRSNIAKVVKTSEGQQRFVKERRAVPASQDVKSDATRGASQEWGVWLSRAKRLQIGSDVELVEGRLRRQVKLGWIGEEFNPFVFVDARGEKDASLRLQALAMYLRRGLALVRDRPELPLVDRSMYAVLHQVHGRIERQATHDTLTGLKNRRSLEAAIAAALKQSTQDHELIHALCQVELDGLDEVGRRGGKRAIAAVVRQAAGELGRAVGPDVIVARIGDGTFGFLIEDIETRRVNRFVQRAQRTVDDFVYAWDEERYYIRARIGIACIGNFTDSEDDAFEAAAHAGAQAAREESLLYMGEPAPTGDLGPAMMDWVTLINRTLGQDRTQLRCQLVKPLDEKDKPYFEVLLSLRDDDDQAIAPADFISALEYYEQMAALDRWVIRNTLKWMAVNRQPVRKVAGFTIKLTGRSLADDHLLEYVLEQLTTTSVPPGKICFEITQGDAFAQLEQAGRLVRTLREFGCRFSLSKFGAGEGVHEELQALPVDFLKIDGRFVRGMATSEDDLAVVVSATHLAHASGLRAVAEFVEDPHVLAQLEALGVDLVQGIAVEAPKYLSELGPAPDPQSADNQRGEAASAIQAAAAEASESESGAGWEDDLNAFLELDVVPSEPPGTSPRSLPRSRSGAGGGPGRAAGEASKLDEADPESTLKF